MNNDRQTKLLAEIFHGDWASGPAAALARAAATSARRGRRVRQTLTTAGATAVFAAVVLLVLQHQAGTPPAAAPARAAPAYEIISDDEFLAELHDRPLLVLPDQHGTRKFVLLEN